MAGSSGTRTRTSPRAGARSTGVPRGRAGRSAVAPARRGRHPLLAPIAAVGSAVAAMWRVLARVVGGLARTVGRNAASARDLEPEHRRDGAALGVLAFALICVMGVWFSAAGPVGRVGRPRSAAH